NERQVGYLSSSPAKLEDDDKRDGVNKSRGLWGFLIASNAGVEYEGKGDKHAYCSCEEMDSKLNS
ncbi:hypothetical protein M9458_017753, partial [Cirrhinus mrigala]